MALKDWKKSNEWKDGFSFINKKNDDYFIQFYKNSSFNPKFRFTIHKNGKFVDDKLFKTKNEGLVYAKSYMRSH